MNRTYHNWANRWFMIPIMLVVVIFAATQYSNATTHLSLQQKPGNHLDDAILTNAVKSADSLTAVHKQIKFGRSLVIPAYILDKSFEMGTNGRRVVALTILLVSFVYLLVLLARYKVLDRNGLLAFAFLYAIAGGLVIETLLGLLGLPLLVLFSVFHMHLLFHFSERSLSKWSYLTIGVVFVVTVLVYYRAIVSVCAVAFALTFGNMTLKSINFRDVLNRAVTLSALLIIPIIFVALLLIFNAPFEMLNPHRGLNNYFFKSSYPGSIWGALTFYTQRSANLFVSAVSPLSIWGRSPLAIWAQITLGFFFLFGLVFSRNTKVFPVALFFVVGTLSYILLNLVSLVPYGNLRYFIPFFIGYPILIANGFSQFFRIIALPLLINRPKFSVVLNWALMILAIGFLIEFCTATSQRNSNINEKFARGIDAVKVAKRKEDAVVVLDLWTAAGLADIERNLAGNTKYELKPFLKTKWRGVPPESLENVIKWKMFLGSQKSVALITSMPFVKENYGSIFGVANARFDITYLARVPVYNFAFLSLREKKQATPELYDLTSWHLSEGTSLEQVLQPQSLNPVTDSAYEIHFPGRSDGMQSRQQRMVWYYPEQVHSGQTLGATMYLWSDSKLDLKGDLIFQFARQGKSNNEFSNRRIKFLNSEIIKVDLNLTFKEDHEGARVAIIYKGHDPIDIKIAIADFRF